MTATNSAEEARRRLEEDRRSLVEQIDLLPIDNPNASSDAGAGQHPADDATDIFLRERNAVLRRNAEARIAMIDDALRRIDDGSYFTCERCGQPIPAERLELMPHVTRCVACQAIVERAA